MKNQLLLLEDVDCLGRSGDLVTVKPGYARNFLVPQKKAIVASKFALRMQLKLQEERKKRAAIDLSEAQKIVESLASFSFETRVKVDPDGGLYGSVSTSDIAEILKSQGVLVEKSQILLPRPIKTLGNHTIQLRLKEGVMASFDLMVSSDQPQAISETEENIETV